MQKNWLVPDKLCSFDEKVRVEIGPQIIELDCNDGNLSDTVTHPNYRKGNRDALGRILQFDKLTDEQKQGADLTFGVVNDGEKMACVDWRAKHAPHVWKVYQMQETGEKDKDGKPISRFIKIADIEGREQALAHAKTVAEGM